MAFDRNAFVNNLTAAGKGIWQRAFGGDMSLARALADTVASNGLGSMVSATATVGNIAAEASLAVDFTSLGVLTTDEVIAVRRTDGTSPIVMVYQCAVLVDDVINVIFQNVSSTTSWSSASQTWTFLVIPS